ncbi:MAG: hypothetical protein ACKVVP_17600, partial [Chloroflexota bacterium]
DVTSDRAGTLLVSGERWLMVAPGLYRQSDGERLLTFGEDAGGNVSHLFRGVLTYFKVPWYEAPSFLLLILALCLVSFLSALSWPLARWRQPARPQLSDVRFARWVAATFGLLSFLFLAAWVALLLRFADTFIYPTNEATLLTRLAMVTLPPLAAVITAMAGVAWKRRAWNLGWRLHYSLIALGSLVLIGWLSYWNLLGPGE